VRGGTRFELRSFAGEAEIRGTRRQEMRIRAEHDRGRIEIDVSASVVQVRPVSRYGVHSVGFVIEVPVGTPITVSAVTGDVSVTGVCGEADVRTAAGEITLDCGRENVTLESAAGDVTASDVTGRIEATSWSGDVLIENSRGTVVARSASGSIQLDGVEGDDLDAQTVSGEVEFRGPIRDNGRYRFQTHSGDVTVEPTNRNLNATVSVNTFSGDLESDFPVRLAPGGRLHSREFEFTIGNGSARLGLSSFSGTIYLRQAGAAGRSGGDRPDRDRPSESARSRDPKSLEIRL